jgi:hypothetical protein
MERQPNHEVVGPSQLYFLTHPGSELFSGYGLTTQEGRKDRLIGLVMVDRPHPVDPAWLAEIEARYGDYQLVPMTERGERGILTQMRIASESVPFLERLSHPIAQEFAQVLKPFLDTPPGPILKLRWDGEQKLWSSAFWVGLPPEMQAVFEKSGVGCFAAERADESVSFVTHVAPTDLQSLRHAPVIYDWQIFTMPTAPLIRFAAAFLDDVYHPYRLEHFLNIGDPDQARCLSRLIEQSALHFDFYDAEYEFTFSKPVVHPAFRRAKLATLIREAVNHYGTIPPQQRDFDHAKALFQRYFLV